MPLVGKCVLSNHSISNHFAGSISKQHLRTTLILPNIQPFCGKYRQIIQPFHLISTSKDILPFCFIQPVFRDIQPFETIQTHIQPLLVYPTAFSKYPTVLIESNLYPTVCGLSNHFSRDIQPFWSIHIQIPPFSVYPTVL